MKLRPVLHILSFVIAIIALSIGGCAAVGWWMGDPPQAVRGLLFSSLAGLALGAGLRWSTRNDDDLTAREGIGIVTLGWLLASLLGAVPYLATGTTSLFIDAWFETVSGFTTTGASILPDPGIVPRGILFWRALTHFFGGMGILVFCVAILPLLGTGGMQIYRAEMSGVAQDRLKPRIASTAGRLWGLYVLLNAVLIALLMAGGMPIFDAVCHAFATVATGGFSTQSASIAAYHSVYIETVLIVFMLLGATNFSLHYRLLHGKATHFSNPEFRFFIAYWLGTCLLITLLIWGRVHDSFATALRHAFFSATSLMSTTGFCTDDFDRWPAAAKVLLVMAMLVGGCAGSTSGGIKQMRVMVALKRIGRDLRQIMHPQAVLPVRMGAQVLDTSAVATILTFFCLYIIIYIFAGLSLTLWMDAETAFSAAAATLGGVGPGFNLAGSTETFQPFAAPAKLIFIFCMLAGRLEFYALLALFQPGFWRR